MKNFQSIGFKGYLMLCFVILSANIQLLGQNIAKNNEKLRPKTNLLKSENGTYNFTFSPGSFEIESFDQLGVNYLNWLYNWNTGDADYLIVQPDGNLVLYSNTDKALWASNTDGKGGNKTYLIMQNDGNLVLYNDQEQPIWSSDSCDNCKNRINKKRRVR